MANFQLLDPNEKAPQKIRDIYKVYRKLSPEQIFEQPDFIDLDAQESLHYGRVVATTIPGRPPPATCHRLNASLTHDDVKAFKIEGLPGKSVARSFYTIFANCTRVTTFAKTYSARNPSKASIKLTA